MAGLHCNYIAVALYPGAIYRMNYRQLIFLRGVSPRIQRQWSHPYKFPTIVSRNAR